MRRTKTEPYIEAQPPCPANLELFENPNAEQIIQWSKNILPNHMILQLDSETYLMTHQHEDTINEYQLFLERKMPPQVEGRNDTGIT